MAVGLFQGKRKKEGVDILIFAASHAQLGEKDQAFEWLEKAYADHDLSFVNVDPHFDPLRDDPRFQDLLARMNREP